MLRDEYLHRLIDEAHVQLHLSANDGARLWWPWRMQPPKEATRSYRDACKQFVIDSDPLDDTVTTTEVLDTAVSLNAEVASLQDVYQDKEATVDSLLAGLETADDHAFSGTLLLPLQDPVVDCWRDLGAPRDHWLGIGGLKDAPVADRIAATERLREAVGDDAHIHGFGWGVGRGLAAAIRDRPALLDSVDYSTPMQSTINPDDLPGAERMSVQAMRAGTRLIRDLRRVSSYPDETDADQQSLGSF